MFCVWCSNIKHHGLRHEVDGLLYKLEISLDQLQPLPNHLQAQLKAITPLYGTPALGPLSVSLSLSLSVSLSLSLCMCVCLSVFIFSIITICVLMESVNLIHNLYIMIL